MALKNSVLTNASGIPGDGTIYKLETQSYIQSAHKKAEFQLKECDNISQEMSSSDASEPGFANDLGVFEEPEFLLNESIVNDSFGLCADRDLSAAGKASLPDSVLMAVQSTVHILLCYFLVWVDIQLDHHLVAMQAQETVNSGNGRGSSHSSHQSHEKRCGHLTFLGICSSWDLGVWRTVLCHSRLPLVLNFSARQYVMLKFAVDRCLRVFSAFHYPKWRTRVVVFMSGNGLGSANATFYCRDSSLSRLLLLFAIAHFLLFQWDVFNQLLQIGNFDLHTVGNI